MFAGKFGRSVLRARQLRRLCDFKLVDAQTLNVKFIDLQGPEPCVADDGTTDCESPDRQRANRERAERSCTDGNGSERASSAAAVLVSTHLTCTSVGR